MSCKLGACVSLDGVDDYVKVLDAAQLRLTGDVTISAWVRPARLGVTQSIVSKRYEFELGPIAAAAPSPLRWSYKQSNGTQVLGDLTSTTEANQWQHVVLVRNAATGQIRGYENGSLALTSGYSFAPGTSTYNVNIGRNPGGIQHFQGLIDQVRVYDRALEASEVRALFEEGS